MGWFEKQIRQRKDLDQQLLEESFLRAAEAVLGEKTAVKISYDLLADKQAVDDIMKYYRFRPVEIPDSIGNDHHERLDYCLRLCGLLKRRVLLEDDWYKNAPVPVLAYTKESGTPVALLPGGLNGYYYRDSISGKKIRINSKNATLFEKEAYCFYRPLPQKKLSIRDLFIYMKNCLTMSDKAAVLLSVPAVALVGMLIPRMTMVLTGPVIAAGEKNILIGIAVSLFCTMLCLQITNIIKEMLFVRLKTKVSLNMQAAMMRRILSLPADFFRCCNSGELTGRTFAVGQLCDTLLGTFTGTVLGSVASLLYITQIVSFAPSLAVPSLLIILTVVISGACLSVVQMRVSQKRTELDAREAGTAHAVISGIQKIKLSGAERRFFAKWLNTYSEKAELTYMPPAVIRIKGTIFLAINLLSTILLYFLAVKSGVTPSAYYAFAAAFGAVMSAFSSLFELAPSAGRIKPLLAMVQPFLSTEPEDTDACEAVTSVSGGIEMNNVYFRYDSSSPYILENVSLKIRAGEYVAVVGRTGCGKSTLLRLLLGFEKPEKGAVYYDGRDISYMDKSSLRQKIGVVMQNEGLFQGNIYSNITVSSPHLTMDDAWEAAETAGIADDIRMMPMGMHTVVSEGQGGISGGQKQRIVIARAVVQKPKILMFDEATSALDNKTQKKISRALDSMGCTRIVIAHRLSTIRHCDRILVLDGGRIAEEGSYDDLIARNGIFADLIRKQRADG